MRGPESLWAVQRKLEQDVATLSIIEWPSACNKCEKDYTSCEKVSLFPAVRFAFINLRRGITDGTLLLIKQLRAITSMGRA